MKIYVAGKEDAERKENNEPLKERNEDFLLFIQKLANQIRN